MHQSPIHNMCLTCGLALDRCACFGVGDTVRFRQVLDPGDELCLFDVIEDNGDRVMIRLICDLYIRPVSVVLRSQLRRADRQ